MAEDKFNSLLKRLEAVTSKLESMPAGGAAAPPAIGRAPTVVDIADDVVSPMVQAFDAFIGGAVAEYVACAGKIDCPEARARPQRHARSPLFFLPHAAWKTMER